MIDLVLRTVTQSEGKSDTEENTQIFSDGHCTPHAGPEGDSPKTPKISELRVLTTPPVVGHDSGGGSQWREAR